MKLRKLAAALAVLAASVHLPPMHARDMTFEDRVRAQEAIERVYYSRQLGATKPFAEAVSREVLQRKVTTYLKQSVALEALWHTPVTAEMLERETGRQARGTRMPERLRELYQALGNDPFLIQECLARPALVDRLTRNFFAYDETIHGAKKREAEALRAALERHGVSAYANEPRRSEVEVVTVESEEALDTAAIRHGEDRRRRVSAEEFARWRARAPKNVGEVGPVEEEHEAFGIHVVLGEGNGSMRLASFTIEKRTWDEWWEEVSRNFEPRSVAAAQPGIGRLPTLRGATGVGAASSCLPDDTWGASSLSPLPEGRKLHTAVWTGTWMIVWGGIVANFPFSALDLGGKYDPATDTWSSVSVVDSPSARYGHTAVWTGSEVIIWGGYGATYLASGGRYDPVTNEWRAISEDLAPSGRHAHTAVWTGTRMVVWGGFGGLQLDTGGLYDPETDTWTPISTSGAPTGRFRHTAVWTGSRMVVWGGFDGAAYLNTGGRYDPATDTWLPVSDLRAPTGRFYHTAVWTETEMIVWGGVGVSKPRKDGGRYDPVNDRWVRTTLTDAPSGRFQHAAVWTGSRMVVWGAGGESTGALYDPIANRWTKTSTVGAPRDRFGPTAVWTGSSMVVWGGDDGNDWTDDNTGGRYDPANDSWTPTSIEGTLRWRSGHTAVWTGTHMIAWGGFRYPSYLRDGGRYDPVLDRWTATSLVHAGPPREEHTAVWTGSEMIVWGGCYDGCYAKIDDGGRYDPIADTWRKTTPVDAPSARSGHVAVWTGSRMIIWGYSSSGGSYDPETNRWTAISTIGAPPANDTVAVWTGNRMLAVGSNYGTTIMSAAQYDPESDTWTPTSTIDAPTPRVGHAVVWTGRELILWGGHKYPNYLNSGARYDPASDTWTPTQFFGSPTPRAYHTAIWTGGEMVVWGGEDIYPLNTGGRYDPATDSWTPVTERNAPAARSRHTAVWTGSEMIVWGGVDPTAYITVPDGGRYAVSDSVDRDGDGYLTCEGDCNDHDGSTHPGAVEVCDGSDNDCNFAIDDGDPPPCR